MTFINCVAHENGGAIDCGDGAPLVQGCTFVGNSSGTGGGICAHGPATIRDCVFIDNLAEHLEYGGLGGGLALTGSVPAQVSNCTFLFNRSAELGGGVYTEADAAGSLLNCTFSGNQAVDGSGAYMAANSVLTLTNSIVAFGDPSAAVTGPGAMTISHSNVFGNTGGDWTGPIAGQLGINGNISLDPLFVDAVQHDVHLRYDSPCRDGGDNNAPGLPENDCEGDPRMAQGLVDMGSDEFYTHFYCTGDFTPGGSVEGKLIGLPGTTPLGLCLGVYKRNPPLEHIWGLFHIAPPWMFVYPLGTMPAEGIMVLPEVLPAIPPAPLDILMQALIGTNSDSLTNLFIMEMR